MSPKNDENDTSERLIEFNINSIDMNMIMAFLRINTPITPMQKRITLKTK